MWFLNSKNNQVPRDGLDKVRIRELTLAINQQFAKDLQIWFKESVNEMEKKQLVPSAETHFDLLQAPEPRRPIREGYLFKIGANVKSWKRRFFVAYNRADNYVVAYFEDSKCLKEKGFFNCCGYSVETFSQEEEELYGEFGIKLIHPNDTKRIWLFRAETEKEQNEWIQTFMNACNKSVSDPNKDVLFMTAFRRALKATRAAYGYFGVCDIIGSEEEMLTQFTKQVLGREVLEEFFVANARRKSVDVISLKNKVNHLIYPVACNTWKKEYTNLEAVKDIYCDAVRASLGTLLRVEESIEQQYGNQIRAILDPILLELRTTICDPILEIALDGTLVSFENAVVCFCQQLVNESEFMVSEQGTYKALEKMKDEVDKLDGFLAPSFTELWNCYTEDLVHMDIMLEKSGSSSYTVYANLLEDIRQLIHNAIFTLQQLICEEDQFKDFPSSPTDSLTPEQITLQYEVMIQRLENDSAKTIEERLIKTILDAMESPLQEMVIGPVQEMMVSGKKVPREVRAMVNMGCVGERIVREMVNNFVRMLLQPAMDKIYPQILQWREQIRSQKYRSISRAAGGSSDLQKLTAELRNMKS